MIPAAAALTALREAGYGLVSGVPCSYLTPLINAVIDAPDLRYVGAANEGDAVAIASGAELGGVRGVVLCQNSGLGNAVSPLTSLNAIFRIPVLLITTWRGQPGGPADEPQHALMGRITPALLDLMEIPWEVFPAVEEELGPALARASAHMARTGTPYGLVLQQGTIGPWALRTLPPARREAGSAAPEAGAGEVEAHDPDDILRAIQGACGAADIVLATTGFTGRALYAVGDRPNQFYLVGSMGCVAGLGLGLALAQPARRVVVVDGDGSLLMRLGTLATIGHERPANLVHVVLDNAVHDSTGAQATVSASMDFAATALACGYVRARRMAGLDAVREVLAGAAAGPTLLHVRTLPRADRKLPRPTITPPEVADRLRAHLASGGRSAVPPSRAVA
ncbi:MAG: phosphonopyruvate decarboxylase [Gemmatimonadota bacterium]